LFWTLQSPSENSGLHQDSNSQSESSLGNVGVHSLTFSYTHGSMRCDSRASRLACTFVNLCLGRELKAKVVTFSNHLHDYKIYGTMIKMFCLKFLNSLWQPPRNNALPTHFYRTWFHRQCDYLFGFQDERKIISKSILLWKWWKNVENVENDAYKTPILTYNMKLNFLVLANNITKSNVEEENSPPSPKDAMTN